jgi:hypothetical protein
LDGETGLAVIFMFEALKGRFGFCDAVTYYGMLYCLSIPLCAGWFKMFTWLENPRAMSFLMITLC